MNNAQLIENIEKTRDILVKELMKFRHEEQLKLLNNDFLSSYNEMDCVFLIEIIHDLEIARLEVTNSNILNISDFKNTNSIHNITVLNKIIENPLHIISIIKNQTLNATFEGFDEDLNNILLDLSNDTTSVDKKPE